MAGSGIRVRIILLNYNGADLLQECLPSICESARCSAYAVRISVLDNQSTDSSEDLVKSRFSSVDFAKAPENLVLCSYNDYLKQISEPIVILLNNDIKTAPDFVDPLVKPFESDDTVFMAAPKVLSFDGKAMEAARTRAGLRFGMFWASARYPGYEQEADTPSETFASGFGAFSRKLFLELGGYDPLYFPGILEDADLCLRARRKGYKLFYEPKSVVYHQGQTSFHREYGAEKTSELAYRNTFLFMWKNFQGIRFWTSHLLFLPFRMVYTLCRGNTAFVKGFWRAVKKQSGKDGGMA